MWRLLLLLLFATTAIAQSPQELLERGELRAALVVDSGPPHYQRAPIVIAVEVATPRWFTRGTRVRDFRIPGAVIRPVSTFADNQTRNIGGSSWSVQRWRFRLYAQEPGPLVLPTLRVFVSINTEQHGTVEGELSLAGTVLEIIAPPGSQRVANWLAAPSLRAEENWEGRRDTYVVGDAITRIRKFVVEDAPAMMLPGSRDQQQEGLSVYVSPASVSDRSERGRLVGTREEQLVITLEAPGSYRIAGEEFHWFNTRSGAVETLTLPEYRFEVAAAPGEEVTGDAPARERPATRIIAALIALAAFLAASLLLALLRRGAGLAAVRRTIRERFLLLRLRHRYHRAVRRGECETALQLLHRRATSLGLTPILWRVIGDDESAAELLRALLERAYGPHRGVSPELPTRRQAETLWQAVSAQRPRQKSGREFQLNPGPEVASQ